LIVIQPNLFFNRKEFVTVKNLNFSLKSLLGMVVLMLLVGVWVAPAAAAPPDEQDNPGLKYGLKRALLQVDALQDYIDFAQANTEVIKEFIQDEQDKGFDTSVLEAALDELQTKIGEAQTLHAAAAQTLDEKAGFDENGEVVEPQQARDTLENARRSMQDARQTLHLAQQDFRQALRDYRQGKRNR
jgi:hypothetical protein